MSLPTKSVYLNHNGYPVEEDDTIYKPPPSNPPPGKAYTRKDYPELWDAIESKEFLKIPEFVDRRGQFLKVESWYGSAIRNKQRVFCECKRSGVPPEKMNKELLSQAKSGFIKNVFNPAENKTGEYCEKCGRGEN